MHAEPTTNGPAWTRLTDPGPCLLWTKARTSGGYGNLKLNGRYVAAHRVAWEQASGQPIPDGLYANHVCDVRHCYRADDDGTYEVEGVLYERRGHLWLGSQAANLADMREKRRGTIGDLAHARRHPELHWGEHASSAKLTTAQAEEIIALYQPRVVTQAMLAERFGVVRSVISRIVHGVRWAHLNAPPLDTSKLTADTVRAIRARYAAGGVTQKALAAEYGISKAMVFYVVKRQVWQHVQ